MLGRLVIARLGLSVLLREGIGAPVLARGTRVFTMRIVPPTQVWPLARRGVEQLVLTACHPPRSDRLRLVVFAKRTY